MSRPADEIDYFTDTEVLKDPYKYFDELRALGPVHQLKCRDMVVVTGFREAVEVLLNTEDFSSVSSVVPTQPLPFKVESDDISEQIEAHRGEFKRADILVSADGARHAAFRALTTVLFTPSRLKANEVYMNELSEKLVGEVVARGGCELVKEVAVPYVTLVIADVLGVPAEDRERFRQEIDSGPPIVGAIEDSRSKRQIEPFQFMVPYFQRYIEDRRANPRNDVLTEFATARYPDGSLPDPKDIINNAVFLFGAGQDTSAKLLGNAMKYIVEDPNLQKSLRQDRTLIPAFLEEVLRLEGSTKATFRLTKKKTRIGELDVAAGKMVIVALAAANRDPVRWENPSEFRLKREKIKEHLAFGRGAHTCIGNPLARTEIRVIINHFFDQTSEITLSEKHHGPSGKHEFSYEPTYIIRGLQNLHIEFKPN
jgi:cytochrome P450